MITLTKARDQVKDFKTGSRNDRFTRSQELAEELYSAAMSFIDTVSKEGKSSTMVCQSYDKFSLDDRIEKEQAVLIAMKKVQAHGYSVTHWDNVMIEQGMSIDWSE